jgi:hypothetical protein
MSGTPRANCWTCREAAELEHGPVRSRPRAFQTLGTIGIAISLLAPITDLARAEIYFGTGGVLCSQYTAAARKQDPLYQTYSQWMLGYVSGMNMAWKEASGAEPLATIPTNNLLQYAGEQCAANPGSSLVTVANDWFMSIPKPKTEAQAEAKSGSSGSLNLNFNLDRAPARKPLLDRR